ncbi:hypothetical protein [Natrinema sp. SYSU A 869]|uniref:hypothetical protein n=1 Tax=Natrinema sp. SYSU A 869 TaxID=2871694 RepID=UPI001CA3A87C|nr:hypothetical protein [Natrinema sp. SYSU A 869]
MRRFLLCTLFGVVLLCGAAAAFPASATATADTSDGNVTLYRADDADLESVSDIRAGIENGTIENASGLLINETLVVEIKSNQLAAELEAENASSTEAFFGSSEVGATDRDLMLSAEITAPGMAPVDIPLGSENTTVRRSGNVSYVIVDSHAVDPEHGSLSDVYNRYIYSLRVDTEAVTIDSDEPSVRFHRSELEVAYLDDGEPLPAEPIRRHVDVNIGTTDQFEAHLKLEGGETRTTIIELDEEGSFSFDLSDVDHGTAYTLEFRRGDETVQTVRGEVLEPYARLEVRDANATTNESYRNASKAVNMTATLSHGGKIRILNPTNDSTYDRKAVSPNEMYNGTLSLVTYDDVVSPTTEEEFHVYFDRGPAALETYYPNGSPAAVIHENGSVTRYAADFETPTADIVDDPPETKNGSTAETGATDGSTEPENTVASDDESADEPSTGDDIPGFTTVATVVALFLVAKRIGRRT